VVPLSARANWSATSTSKVPPAQRRPRSVRHYLTLLTVAVAIPLIGLAFYVSHRVATSEREATSAALLSNARSLAAAVDQEIDKHIAVATTLAHSRSLLNGDWPTFWQQARETVEDLPESSLTVVDPGGQVLVDTSMQAGTALPRRPLYETEQEALRTGRPEISGVVTDFTTHQARAFAVIPLFRDGNPLYLLDVNLNPARFQAMLREQHSPPDWLTGIVDRNGDFIARFPDDDGTKVGQPASEGWRRAMRQSPQGIAEHASLEGNLIDDAYARSVHGWTVGVAISHDVLEAPLRRTQWLLLAASLGCIGFGLLFAWLIARKLHGSAGALHHAAEALAREQPVTDRPTGVREYDEAVAALAVASRSLRARAEERDRASQALRDREAELEAVINRTPFMLARCSRDFRYRFVSKSFAEMLGRKPEDIIGRPIIEIIGAEAFKTVLPHFESVLRGEFVEGESEVRYEGTGTRFVRAMSTPEMDEHGDVVGWVASMLDITEQKRAEQQRQLAEAALAKSADEHAALYEFANRLYRADSLSVVYDAALNASLRALHCHRAAIQRLDDKRSMRFVAWHGLSEGYRNAASGHSPWAADELNPRPLCIDDIDRAALPDAVKVAAEAETVQALWFIPLMSSAGKLAGILTAYYQTPHPVTQSALDLALNLARRLGFAAERIQAEQARQLAEQELRKLKEQLESEVEKRTLERDRIWNVSEDLLGVSNVEGYFTSINPAWTKLLGWTEDEIKSMHVSELRHPEDALHSMAVRAQMAQGTTTVRMENRFRHKDGSWRWMHWTMTSEGGLIYVSGRHVTLEKEAAAALERAQQRSAHSQKIEALGQLTGGVAHDFNNLLMIVSGHAQRLKRHLSDPIDLRAIEAIQIASTRGEGLTRQLLSFSRGQPLNPTVISPAETISAIRDVLAGSLHVNIELSIDVAPTTWPVRVDKSELELALVNLAVNARDAMPVGGKLSIAAENVHLQADDTTEGLSGDFVALSVADTGSGIPKHLLGKVFEPFFTTKGADKGTGLGLSQVYGFARRSGGTAAVRSEQHSGATVTVYLPRSHAQIDRPLAEDAGHYMAPAGVTVLVVEDNHEVRAVTVSLLEQLGYRTIAVETAAAALDALAASQPVNVIFSDVVLPGEIDGLLLARTVEARYPDIPIVLTTGYAKVFAAEPEYPVLRKPYQIPALGRIIREALDAAKAKRTALAS
jgi:PAS domain S-box-containing protein